MFQLVLVDERHDHRRDHGGSRSGDRHDERHDRGADVDHRDGNRLDGGAADDDPLPPTVFAVGRVSPAFVAIVGADGAVPTWTLRGTDGVVRTAAPTATTPACNGAPEPTTPDTRAGQLAVTFGPTVVGTAAAPKVAATVRLDGR